MPADTTGIGSAPRVGAVFRPDGPPECLQQVARAAEHARVEELWLWEDCFLQGGIAQTAAALASSETLTVGIGVMPAPLRNVAVTAMEIATLGRMFPGRLRVGIGHGVQSWMRQVGGGVESPMTLLREYIVALRDLLAGRSVSADGRYVRLDDVRLHWAPSEPVPLLIGATGPRTLKLAGELADGVILDCQHGAADVADALANVALGRDRSVSPVPFSTVVYLSCAPGDDFRWRLTTEAAAWTFEPHNDFGGGGTAEDIAVAATPYLDAGVDTLVFQPLESETCRDGFIEAIGQVKAHVQMNLRTGSQ
jgi:alkanesulfonate monooxygenase SsuD/methylene tetrahydromethanopterin reductase-like flavin-dependent oxidoreductase (luciferase family)